MNDPVNSLLKTVSEIRDLQASIAEVGVEINKISSREDSIRCFIMRMILEAFPKYSEISVIEAPFCVVQIGSLRRMVTRREGLEKQLSILRENLTVKFQEHDYYQEQALFCDIAKLNLV